MCKADYKSLSILMQLDQTNKFNFGRRRYDMTRYKKTNKFFLSLFDPRKKLFKPHFTLFFYFYFTKMILVQIPALSFSQGECTEKL